MSELMIKTDYKWREFVYRSDVPAKVLKSQFDWTDEAFEEHGDYSDGFFRYRGYWYHLNDFMTTRDTFKSDTSSPIKAWDGYHGDSYFSGVLIKLSKDGERFQVATYFS